MFRCSIWHLNRLLDDALDQEAEKALTDLWVSMYPYMQMEWLPTISYPEFRDKILGPKQKASDKALEEIEQEMNQVIAQYESTRKAVS